MKDFFISYNKADRDWATSIDRWLKETGYSTHIQEIDFPPGSNWAYEMVRGGEAARTIAVLSPDYLNANWTWPEMLTAFAADPKGEKRKLLFVRVRECQLPQLLSQIVDINLIGKSGEEARRLLLAGIETSRQELGLPEPYPIDKLLAQYCDHLQRKVSTVRIFGDEQPHQLDQVFVELTINEDYERRPNQAEFLGLMDSDLRKMRSVFGDADDYREVQNRDREGAAGRIKTKITIKPDELLRRHNRAIVTGAPGCGKTTLLRYLAWQTLKQWRIAAGGNGTGSVSDLNPETQNNPRLPVFLELKSFSADDFKSSRKRASKNEINLLAQLLFDKVLADQSGATTKAERDALKQHFLELLREGRVAIFLDGLDEVSGAKFFGELQTAVTDFLHSAYGKNTVIISTRPFALRQFGEAKMMEIQPLSPRQIEQFIEHYHNDLPKRQQFQRELRRRRELREQARVPALLGFILQLWRKHGSVTDDKLELYAQITREMAQQLDSEKEVPDPTRPFRIPDADGSLKCDFLRQLAFNRLFQGIVKPPYDLSYTTNNAGRFVFTSKTLLDEAKKFTKRIKDDEGILVNPRDLTEDVKVSAMLRQVGADHYAFVHLTLQEYLAATELKEHPDCECLFSRAYFNRTLAEMEVLPMTLGLVDQPEKFYKTLEQLPKPLNHMNLRLRARGLAFAQVGDHVLQPLVERLIEFIVGKRVEEKAYCKAIYRAFTGVRGRSEELIISAIAKLLCEEQESKVYLRAAEALGDIASECSVGVLLQSLLNGTEPNVRAQAAAALGNIGSERAVEALLQVLLNDAEYSVRASAAKALSSLAGEYTEAALIRALLSDAEYSVRASAASALGRIKSERAVEVLLRVSINDTSSTVRDNAAAALGRLGGERAVDTLLPILLNDAESDARERVVAALGRIKSERPVEALLHILLNDAESDVRRNAAAALGNIGSERAEGALLQALLNDAISDVRRNAAAALGNIGSERAEGALRQALLNDAISDVRERAATALGRIKSKGAMDTLLQVLFNDAESSVRRSAAATLGDIGGTCSEEALLQALLNDVDSSVRGEAAKALGRLGSERALEALLQALLNDSQSYVRGCAAKALGRLGGERAEEALLQSLLNDPKSFVRGCAAEGLGSIGSVHAFGALLQALLNGAESNDREGTAGTLGDVENERAFDALLDTLLFGAQSDVRRSAIEALEQFTNETLAHGLLGALRHEESSVRRKAAEVVGYYVSEPALPELMRLFTDDPTPEVRQAAAQAQTQIYRKLQYCEV